MNTTVKHLADRLGADQRTLRRAVEQGTVRCSRVSPRRVTLPVGEEQYLREYLPLLQRLVAALRTEPNVRLAVVFGSIARGDAGPESDLDLLVELSDSSWDRRRRLNTRLERTLGRSVELALLERIREDNPSLLLDALREGRVVIDRARLWPTLQQAQPAVQRAARDDEARQADEARAALDELIAT